MRFETITFETKDRVGTLTMNRPDEANALNAQMAKELFEISVLCSRDKNLGALIVTANGKMFNAGGDLKEFDNPQEADRMNILVVWLPIFIMQLYVFNIWMPR